MTNRGEIALRNLNETTRKYKRWVDRWYYSCGSLECRICSSIIHEKCDVCLYDGKVVHVECINRFNRKVIAKAF
jgi:hypothetical protein